MELIQNIADSERLLTPTEMCDALGVAPHVLRRWRKNGTGPRYYRLGHKTVRYPIEGVREWLATKAVA